jgi:hypothetical protein
VNVISTMEEPATFEEAKLDSKWCKAMEEEIHALEKKLNLNYMPSAKNKIPVGCKLVYKIKYNSD